MLFDSNKSNISFSFLPLLFFVLTNENLMKKKKREREKEKITPFQAGKKSKEKRIAFE